LEIFFFFDNRFPQLVRTISTMKRKRTEELIFVTGNENKLKEVQAIIGDSIKIVAHKLDCKALFSLFNSSIYISFKLQSLKFST